MKPALVRVLLASVCLAAFVATASPVVSAAEEESKPGSIRPEGKVKKVDLPALAKISFDAAMHAALTAVPGKVIVAELEVENGSLMYSFEIVTPTKSVKEVEIDAGNAAVLGIEDED